MKLITGFFRWVVTIVVIVWEALKVVLFWGWQLVEKVVMSILSMLFVVFGGIWWLIEKIFKR